MTTPIPFVTAALAALLSLGPAAAAEGARPALDTGNTAWMLTATALVLLMTVPGLALFYAGMVRKKNILSMMMQSFALCSLVTVLWVAAGYSLAFSEGNAFVGGVSKAMMMGIGIDSLSAGNVPETVFVVFQMTFAIITPALVTGAFAERMRFSAMLLFMGLWLFGVYVPVAHWVWGGGFLGAAGVLDYAGGTVVHVNAGVAGLVAALVLGPRSGFGVDNLSPANLALAVIGASLLWVGWFGFNAGSAVAADGRAGMAMLVTQVAAASAALAWMFAEWALRGKPSVLGVISGAVAGLVAITPASGFVGAGAAMVIGAVAGAVCLWGVTGLKRLFAYDDSLDCFGVHGLGGMVGALLTGVFAQSAIGGTAGLVEGNAGQLATQAWGVLVVALYCAAVTWLLLKLIDLTIGLRVAPDLEREGLDLAIHGERIH